MAEIDVPAAQQTQKLRHNLAAFKVELAFAGVLLVVALVAGVLFTMYNWSRWTFPDIEEIDGYMEQYLQETSNEDRIKILDKMLDRIRFWEWEEQDIVVEHTFKRLTDCYLTNHDPAILTALRNAPFDAHLREWRDNVVGQMEKRNPSK